MSQQDPSPQEDIQANLVRAARFADGKSRDWTLFFFFRIMTAAEVEATIKRLEALAKSKPTDEGRETLGLELLLDFMNPSLVNVGLHDDQQPESPEFAPTDQYRNWLKAMVLADSTGLKADAARLAPLLTSRAVAGLAASGASAAGMQLGLLHDQVSLMTTEGAWKARIEAIVPSAGAGQKALEGGLLSAVRYEILRQLAPAFLSEPPSIRAEAAEERPAKGLQALYDPAAVNIAFSWSGLQALRVHPDTLASFPEPFREGMADRARRLRDTGPSSPASWESAFGLPRMHGYFTGGFLVGGEERRAKEKLWQRLRGDIAAFNAPESHEDGPLLRACVGALFRPFGLEILHMELGQDPYDIKREESDEEDYAWPKKHRVEHFGFRDGLSQPFADLNLGDAGPGQGTPSRNRTWSPVAPGELYLDLPDEDGEVARLPVNAQLRRRGTYVVFRKLEQDVVGFRSFTAQTTEGDAAAAGRLAAEFVGRWPSGTPLVLSPDTDRTVPPGAEDRLNDFLFAKDDPSGAKCPLGAHIRRANPRDTGGTNDVRRHRLLRRGMSYGGSLLPPSSLGDGEARGLLFVAMNARLDQQFEVVQAEWLNSGEFLGQAGLGRCPVVGEHAGGRLDSFRRAGEVAPITGLPSFVTMRGGEYFFACGIGALQAMTDKTQTFPPDDTPYGGYSLGDARTQGLFSRDRLEEYVKEILQSLGGIPSKQPVIKVCLPAASETPPERMAFVGRYKDVVHVLSGGPDGGPLEFSVQPYHESAQRLTRGHDLIISTDAACPSAETRERLQKILKAAWRKLKKTRPDHGDLSAEIAARLSATLRRCGPAGRIDLVDDLATSAAYAVVSRVYGVPGPEWLTELAAALPFGEQHLSELPADWLKALKASTPGDPGVITLQTWSAVMLADVIANLQSAQEAWPLSRQAGSEMLSHIDALLAKARADAPAAKFTLVDAFVANTGRFVGDCKLYPDRESYFREAAVVLAEVTANTIAATPSAFGSVMQFLLDNNVPLRGLAWRAGKETLSRDLAEQVIYECDRLNPVLPVLQRLCTRDTKLGSGAEITAGDRVAALIAAANMDGSRFADPLQFSLSRPQKHYLMFGAPDSDRDCWGRDIAMQILTACLLTASSLENLRGVAGKEGGPRKVIGALTISLPARFTPIRRSS